MELTPVTFARSLTILVNKMSISKWSNAESSLSWHRSSKKPYVNIVKLTGFLERTSIKFQEAEIVKKGTKIMNRGPSAKLELASKKDEDIVEQAKDISLKRC